MLGPSAHYDVLEEKPFPSEKKNTQATQFPPAQDVSQVYSLTGMVIVSIVPGRNV